MTGTKSAVPRHRPRRLVVIGAGGQARETIWLIRDLSTAAETFEVAGCVVSDLAALGDRDSRDQVLGDFEWLHRNRNSFDGLAMGIGTPAARLRIAAALEPLFPESWWPALVHPSNPMDRSTCTIGHGTMICAGSIATVGVTFEPFAMANFGCSIGHEAVVGRASVVNPGANLSGGVRIGAGVLVGTGAQVLQYLSVGDGARVGAGAVVTRSVSADTTVVGVPARPLLPSSS